MSNKEIEQEIQAKGLTAPRVTPADIEMNIVHTEIVKHVTPSGQTLRWAVLTLKNGYAATGAPSCSVSPENDDEEIGKEYAIINAKETLWPLMGYALKQKLHECRPTKAQRLANLYAEIAQHMLEDEDAVSVNPPTPATGPTLTPAQAAIFDGLAESARAGMSALSAGMQGNNPEPRTGVAET